MEITDGLGYNEKKLLIALDGLGGSASPADIVRSGDFCLEVEVMGAASWLAIKGLVTVREDTEKFFELSDNTAVENGLPERRALNIIGSSGGRLDMDLLSKEMPAGEDKIAIGWLKRKKLADIVTEDISKFIVLTDKGKSLTGSKTEDELLLERMAAGPISEGDADPQILRDLKGRQGMIREKTVAERIIMLTDIGREAISSGIELTKEITDITDRLIQSDEWKTAQFRKYDVGIFAPVTTPAKRHPLTRLGNEIRQLFTNMGFVEMSSEYVQPAFWNLDVLFTPQDHPARDIQDTFYLDCPCRIDLRDRELVQKVKDIHENGGSTGSTGWGGVWSIEKAEAALLRTHSTVSSIRYIAEHNDAPQKAFSISRIFRKESIDSTHLPEFTQIEGIVIDENGNFDMLISMIKEFYARMGFDRIRIRPAYFPYTEPSLEVEVFFNGRWMELGGAGIFRPEVTEPFGVRHPVLAWGFGFERLAMLKWDIKDIRDLYISDIDDLKKNAII
ncbi:MAG: phenylalanine--tRNA ligase subunit alpha [Candidatus Methanoplasma sp.]|jgi:phenylalanyl-tRNA synthetase alpha chain|nr:phenylalanine--tRNA ligase subunit alpha [Candidatus Methanoplasma sp.]